MQSSHKSILIGLLAGLLTSAIGMGQESSYIYSRTTTFYVPFTVGEATSDETPPQEIQLYVSGDRGQSWQLYQRQPANAGRFSFRAAIDGEFWFAVRTVASGDSTDAVPSHEAELKVIVDTQMPQIKLAVGVNPNGYPRAEWQIEDTHLDLRSFRVEYQKQANGPWLSANSPEGGGVLEASANHVVWNPAMDSGLIAVRASVMDKSGNLATTQRQINLSDRSALAQDVHGPAENSAEAAPREDVPPLTNPTDQQNLVPGTSPEATPQHWQSQRAIHPVVPHQDRAAGWNSATNTAKPLVTSRRMPQIEVPQLAQPGQRAMPAGPVASLPQNAQPSNPSAAIQARMSRSRRFNLDYDVEAVTADAVSKAELWVTMDNGDNWQFFGNDPDLQSPMLVNVDNDGVYGFRMVIQSSDGVRARPPQRGDPADIWIQVDATPPTARITAARFGRGAHLGTLQVYWEATDANLINNPATLLFSDKPDGPWRILAENLQNTGRYDWTVDDSLPQEFYLQLEIHDRAGNISRDTMRDAISRDGLAPQGRILDVRPAKHSPAVD